VESGKSCDLTIPPSKLRRIHKERLRVRDAIREAKAKLSRLRNQLRQLEDEEKEIVSSKWDIINVLEGEEKSSAASSNLPFDVASENFQFSKSFDWSPFAAGPLNLSDPNDAAVGGIAG